MAPKTMTSGEAAAAGAPTAAAARRADPDAAAARVADPDAAAARVADPDAAAAGAAAPAAPSRAERAADTRERLLDATIESLVAVGYRRSSMREICERAGVSRGAQLHHFPTKAKLMTAAVEHLTRRQLATLQASAEASGADSAAAMVDLVWAGFSGTLARAATELWTASATDPELRAALRPVDRALGRTTLELARARAGDRLDAERLETLFWLTVHFTRGLALDELLEGDPARRARLLAAWKALVEEAAAR